MVERTGRLIHILTANAQAPTMNRTGTTGYPQVRKGRGKFGSVIRIRIMAATANP